MAASAARLSQPNLLEGPLFIKMLWFILPLMLTNLLQSLYNAADMIVVGMSPVQGAIGAIGTTAAMINLIINVFIGFSMGANVVVARCIGARERGETQRAVHTAVVSSVIFGFVGLVIGQLACRPLLILLGDEGHILELATLYSRIIFAGAPFTALANTCIAILRAKGDTKTPLYVLTTFGLVNVLLNLFFVLVCGMSVDGVAYATVIANALSALVLMMKLRKDTGWCRLSIRKLRIHWRSFRDIIAVGIPAAIQAALFAVSNMTIQSSIIQVNNTMFPGGSAVIDGNAAGSNLEGFCYVAENSAYQASITFTSQHYGAGKKKRLGMTMLYSYIIASAIATVFSLSIMLLHKPLVGLYVSDPASHDVCMVRMKYTFTTYFLLAWMEIGSGINRGMGKSVTSMLITLMGVCALRVVWVLFIFPLDPTLENVYISYPVSWILTAVVQLVFVLHHYRKFCRGKFGHNAAYYKTTRA